MNEPEVEAKLKELAVLREQSKTLAAKVSEVQRELIDMLGDYGEAYESDSIKGTVVRSQSTTYDTEMMKSLLPDSIWVKVSDRVLSPDKLEDCISKGKVAIEDIIDAVVIKDRSPFVKITLKAGDA